MNIPSGAQRWSETPSFLCENGSAVFMRRACCEMHHYYFHESYACVLIRDHVIFFHQCTGRITLSCRCNSDSSIHPDKLVFPFLLLCSAGKNILTRDFPKKMTFPLFLRTEWKYRFFRGIRRVVTHPSPGRPPAGCIAAGVWRRVTPHNPLVPSLKPAQDSDEPEDDTLQGICPHQWVCPAPPPSLCPPPPFTYW